MTDLTGQQDAPGNGSLTLQGDRWAMRLLVLLCLLAACNTPTGPFRGLAPQRVTVDGSTFDVRVSGDLAEAIRVNAQYAPRMGPIDARAARAMAEVSGCRVKRVTGDQALLLGRLDC
jgi:hypothetical protein